MAIQIMIDTTVPTTAQVMLRSAWYQRRSDALRRLWCRPRAGRRTHRA